MQNPFFRSAGPAFADRDSVLALAREIARHIAAADRDVLRVLLFGSFARGDFGFRSDLDLLVVVADSDQSPGARVSEYLKYASAYPTDILCCSRKEIEQRILSGEPFVTRALEESIQLYPE